MIVQASILIPAYRAEGFLHHAVRSALAQDFDDFEVIISADDGVDYAVVLAAQGIKDAWLRFTGTGGVGRGPAAARNAALALARGDVIVSLDADDRLSTNYLSVMVPHAQAHGAASCANLYIDLDTGEALDDRNVPLPAGVVMLSDLLVSKIQTYANLCFSRRRIPFCWPAQVERWEDVCMFALCCDALGGVYWEPRPLYAYYRRQGSICNRDETAEEFTHWCQRIARMVERGELEFSNADKRQVFVDYLECRRLLEVLYERGYSAGLYRDYMEFLSTHGALFHMLDVEKIRAQLPR